MKRTITISIRAMFAIAVMMILALAMSRTASAQGTAFDVKAVSGGEGQFNEFPLTYTIEYDNEVQQNLAIGGPGLQTFVSPPGVVNVVAIWIGGLRYVVQSHVVFCFPRVNGGCWCLCLQWVGFAPFLRPRLFWYYNPCC